MASYDFRAPRLHLDHPLAAGARPVGEWVIPAIRPGDFVATKVARLPGSTDAPGDVSLTPFYRTHRRRYSVYFDIV